VGIVVLVQYALRHLSNLSEVLLRHKKKKNHLWWPGLVYNLGKHGCNGQWV